jgi:hypothetical protein
VYRELSLSGQLHYIPVEVAQGRTHRERFHLLDGCADCALSARITFPDPHVTAHITALPCELDIITLEFTPRTIRDLTRLAVLTHPSKFPSNTELIAEITLRTSGTPFARGPLTLTLPDTCAWMCFDAPFVPTEITGKITVRAVDRGVFQDTSDYAPGDIVTTPDGRSWLALCDLPASPDNQPNPAQGGNAMGSEEFAPTPPPTPPDPDGEPAPAPNAAEVAVVEASTAGPAAAATTVG